MPPQEPTSNNPDSNLAGDTAPITPTPMPSPTEVPAPVTPDVSRPSEPALGASRDFGERVITPLTPTPPSFETPTEPSPATAQDIGGTVVAPTVSSPAAPSEFAPQVVNSTAPTAGQITPQQPIQPPILTDISASSPMPQPMVISGSATTSPVSSSINSAPGAGSGKKKRTQLIAAVIALVVILGGGYTFAFYLPNTPSNVYTTGLDRTAQAYDKLVDYTKSAESKHFKSVSASGDFKFVSSAASADGTFTAKSDDKNFDSTVNVNVAGIKANLNLRGVTASGQTTPDLYFQVNGVKSVLNTYGLSQFASLDGQWVSVDHTLLESAAASADGDASSNSKVTSPTAAQVQDALNRIGQTNRQYLFKADASHAVLKKEKYLGKSTRDGRQVYGYTVGYDKAHLKDYVKGLQTAVNDSSLNNWVKDVSGKSASEADISSILSSIDHAKSNYTFTMYIDAKTKLISTLHFKDTTSSDYWEIGQGYTGGTVYPFSVKIVSTSDPKDAGTFELTAKLDSAANKVTFGADLDAKEDGSPITFKLNATATMGNDTVNVTAPAGAKSVLDVYQSLLGSELGTSGFGDSSNTLDTSSFDDFTLTQ